MAIPPDLLKQVRVSLMIFNANALLSLFCPLNDRKGHDLGERGLASHDKRQCSNTISSSCLRRVSFVVNILVEYKLVEH
jgi:hypothetical protein